MPQRNELTCSETNRFLKSGHRRGRVSALLVLTPRNIFLRHFLFIPQCVPNVTALSRKGRYKSWGKAANKGREISMRVFIACAIILTAAIGLGGCFGHHEKAVMAEPLKLG